MVVKTVNDGSEKGSSTTKVPPVEESIGREGPTSKVKLRSPSRVWPNWSRISFDSFTV